MKITALVTVSYCLFAGPSLADDVRTTVGNFVVSTSKDPFNDSGSTVVAMAISGNDVVAIRCIENTLSLAVAGQSHPLTAGDVFSVKFRADNKEIIDTEGHAINGTVLELVDADHMIDELNGAKSVSIRVSGDTSSYTFTVPLKQSEKAVPMVKKACGK